jgi:hypothetical protein
MKVQTMGRTKGPKVKDRILTGLERRRGAILDAPRGVRFSCEPVKVPTNLIMCGPIPILSLGLIIMDFLYDY